MAIPNQPKPVNHAMGNQEDKTRRKSMNWLLMVMVLLIVHLGGCSNSPNPNAPTTTAAHGANWLLTHGPIAQQDLVSCEVCHGATFTGSGPVPSCFECHLGGPPFFIHPPSPQPNLTWQDPVNHGAVAKADLTRCQGCHGQVGGAGSNPPFDVALGSLEKGCDSVVGCHNNTDLVNTFNNGHNPGAAHPVYDPNALNEQDLRHWYGENIAFRTTNGVPLKNDLIGHFNAGNMTIACALCHGANLKGLAEGGVGPACMNCHVLDPIANPSRCVSCHGPLPALPGQPQQSGPPLKPLQLAALAGRTGLSSIPTFQVFTSALTARMRRDQSYVTIVSNQPQSGYYFEPTIFLSYTSVRNLSNRSSHLNHDSLPCSDRQNNATCTTCHTDKATDQTNEAAHHSLITSMGLNCLNCHLFTSVSGQFVLGSITDCQDCHLQHFCQ